MGKLGAAALFAVPLLAACASDPAYPPPSDEEARAAYARAIRADLIDSPPQRTVEGPTDLESAGTPVEAGRRMGGVFNQEAEISDRLNAQRRLDTLTRVTVADCSWGSIDAGDIRPYGRDRVEGKVADGYSCGYEVFHDSDRGLVSARGTGYFFHRDGAYDFASVDVASFETVDAQ